MENIKILSIEACPDEDYGESIVQYQVGSDFVSFAFTSARAQHISSDMDTAIAEIKEDLESKDVSAHPLWSDLSVRMKNLILESEFDMLFVEYDDDDWTEELADEIWEEAARLSLGCVRRDEDGCYLTVYAGAMSDVNWTGHPYYGKPCLQHNVEAILLETKEQPFHLIKPFQWDDLNFHYKHIAPTTNRDGRLDDLFQHLSENNLHGRDAYDYVGKLDWLSDAFGPNSINDQKMFLMLEGLKNGLSADQVSLYAYPSYPYSLMDCMCRAFESGLSADTMDVMLRTSPTGGVLLNRIFEYIDNPDSLADYKEILQKYGTPSLAVLREHAIAKLAERYSNVNANQSGGEKKAPLDAMIRDAENCTGQLSQGADAKVNSFPLER